MTNQLSVKDLIANRCTILYGGQSGIYTLPHLPLFSVQNTLHCISFDIQRFISLFNLFHNQPNNKRFNLRKEATGKKNLLFFNLQLQ
jgi:hypothetical protein